MRDSIPFNDLTLQEMVGTGNIVTVPGTVQQTPYTMTWRYDLINFVWPCTRCTPPSISPFSRHTRLLRDSTPRSVAWCRRGHQNGARPRDLYRHCTITALSLPLPCPTPPPLRGPDIDLGPEVAILAKLGKHPRLVRFYGKSHSNEVMPRGWKTTEPFSSPFIPSLTCCCPIAAPSLSHRTPHLQGLTCLITEYARQGSLDTVLERVEHEITESVKKYRF